MFSKMAFYSAMLTIMWIYPTISAPMEGSEDENSIIEENSTSSCFRDTFPLHLQMHFDMCMGNNLSEEENLIKESDVLSCVIQAAGAMNSEEKVDASKLDIVLTEDEGIDENKTMEEPTLFSLSVKMCDGKEEVKMPEDFVQCLFEALSVSCINSTLVPEESTTAEAEEEMM